MRRARGLLLRGAPVARQRHPQRQGQTAPVAPGDLIGAYRIERELQEKGDKEISCKDIGERVMQGLHGLDEVAYVRFASVYRSFKDINEFMNELKDILNTKEMKAPEDGAQ